MKTSGFQAHPTLLKVLVGEGILMCIYILTYIYIYMVAPPKTYVFYKNTAIYSVSRTFWPLDFGSFFGGHHM